MPDPIACFGHWQYRQTACKATPTANEIRTRQPQGRPRLLGNHENETLTRARPFFGLPNTLRCPR